jgi:hypothetical protein
MADDSDDDSFMAEMKSSVAKRGRAILSAAQAKKARREEAVKGLLNSALKSGQEKLAQETRMGEIQKRNSVIKSPETMDKERAASRVEKNEIDTVRDLFSSNVDSSEPIDIKATACLGTRNTLKLLRVLDATDSTGKPHSVTRSLWSNFDDAKQAFVHAVHWELQQSQQEEKKPTIPSQHFVWYYDELLDQTSTTRNFVFCLREKWLCIQNFNYIRHLPPSVLHWLFTMACAPILVKVDKSKPLDAKSITVNADLLSAKQGAYNTLCGLWSDQNGFPSQQKYLLTLGALSDQLREWFGSTFMVEKEERKEKGDGIGDENLDENKPAKWGSLCLSSSTDLIRFLHLWALAFQNDLVCMFPNGTVDNARTDFEKEAANVVMTLLWAAVDPAFASRLSAQDDGQEDIRLIISCILDAMNKTSSNNLSYMKGIETVTSQVFGVWSKQLGPGPNGTDAKDDKLAWLSLSRTVQSLGSSPRNDNLTGLQLSLCKCIIQNALRESSATSHEDVGHDWLSLSVNKALQQWKVPNALPAGSWKDLGVAVVALSTLAASFPADDPAKCYSVVQCAILCIRLAVLDLCNQLDLTRKPVQSGSEGRDEEHQLALLAAMNDLESSASRVSAFCRSRIMQNKCFPLASSALECIKSYAKLLKGKLAPPKKGETKQTTMDSFITMNKSNSSGS